MASLSSLNVIFLLGRNVFASVATIRGAASVAEPRLVNLASTYSLVRMHQERTLPSRIHGIILERSDSEELALAKMLGCPTVVLFDHAASGHWSTILPDEVAVGRVVAEHFVERGVRSLAFVGPTSRWSRLRSSGFSLTANERGARVLPPRVERSWTKLLDLAAMASWLALLPRPVGVLAANDEVAVVVRNAALSLKLAVPEEVSIVGVDNNELRCRYGAIPLSSVDLNAERIGCTAMEWLLSLPAGSTRDALQGVRLVPPAGVVVRRSSDVLAVADPEVRDALQFIADHACRGIRVPDVLEHVLLSRSSLDRRMKAVIGRTPADEITRVRIAHAKRLLRETEMTLAEVASASGYEYLSHFSHAFRQATGVPPMQFRRQERRFSPPLSTSGGK